MSHTNEDVVITVSDCHIVICRRRKLSNGSISYECAWNAEELEADAMNVLAKGGQPFMAGQEFSCPKELAERARWN